MIDQRDFETQRKHLAGVGKSGLHQLPAEQRGADAATLEREIALEKQKARPDRAKVSRLESLLEMRHAEVITAPNYAEMITAPNYKVFLWMVLRDPDMTLRYVIVDGSKVEAFGGRVQTTEVS